MIDNSPLFLGFDLSTQQLKAIAVSADLRAHHEEIVDFDADLGHYGIAKGVHKNDSTNEVYAPVLMWVEAVDLVLSRMREKGFDFSRVKGLSGAGQQHGSVYWSSQAESILASMDPKESLVKQFESAFSHPWSPNWQDHSTQLQCDEFQDTVDGAEELARITGSRAHHRFTGPQIMKFHKQHPETYERTARISLVSSFLCSLFIGRIAPFDISDVCGMNLWDIHKDDWHPKLLARATEGDKGGVEALKLKLGDVEKVHGKALGKISSWFVERFGFSKDCTITPFTGDNPSTILALPLRPLDAIVSLGTSTTLLMVTPTYHPSVEYHLFNHPTTPGQYMFMLCYTNGALAREKIRNTVNDAMEPQIKEGETEWLEFNKLSNETPVGGRQSKTDPAKIGVYFHLPENIPNVKAGIWRFNYAKDGSFSESTDGWNIPYDDARAILESQALSMRMRATPLLKPEEKNGNKSQPGRVYVVGGASRNQAIAEAMGDVLGGHEGVFRLDIGGNACALGAAYYATWALERKDGEAFEDFIGARWDEKGRVSKIAPGYKQGVFEDYGEILEGYRKAEELIVRTAHN